MWADAYIERLSNGETIAFRPRGNSMVPLIRSGQLITVAPITKDTTIKEGSIVLCTVNDRQYVHLVKAVQQDRYQIGNNRGLINGWIGYKNLYGIVIGISD